MKNITYAIDLDTGLVVSRVGSELAWPILEYDKMKIKNNFAMDYSLEKIHISVLAGRCWDTLKWTKKIPIEIKNIHRRFWGFEELKK